jgi:hypothetical protein
MVIDTPEGISAYRALVAKGVLKLESLGMKSRNGSISRVIEQITNGEVKAVRRNKKTVLVEYEQWLVDKGILIR